MSKKEELINLLSKSYSVFHVVKNIEDEFIKAGYIKLDECKSYHLEANKNYYVKRNDSSIIAFKLPNKLTNLHFQLTATHNDSPTFKLKPNPIKKIYNLIQLNTEPYGGGIYNTWFDKPLSIAGRVYVRNGLNIHSHLLNIDEDLCIIPNVCIHMNREINSGYKYNPSVDTLPILGVDSNDFDFNSYLLSKLNLTSGEVIAHDLYLYNREKPALLGINKEFLTSPREDDLASTYSVLLGFLSAKRSENTIQLFASFDNEEVGSLTKQGANSTFLIDTLKRISSCLDLSEDEFRRIIASSVMLSIDNAHANHPNHPELSDKNTMVTLNGGIVIKYNANQTYTSDALSSSIVKGLCLDNDIPYQEYTNRSDLRGGSTLGNLSQAEISITTVDIGLPQLAMHSSYETLGARDIDYMVKLTEKYFESDIKLTDNNIALD